MLRILNLFSHLSRRTSLEDWELGLLINVFSLLPDEYQVHIRQIEEGLIRGVLLSDAPAPNYVNFTFNPKISKKFEDAGGRLFRITDIQVFDTNFNLWTELQIYITHGLVCGYCAPSSNKFLPDITKIKTDNFKKEYLDGYELELMKRLLSEQEIQIINPSDFYEIALEGMEFYHLKDLEDGDFIGIDEKKTVYKITHDPFEIIELQGDILSNLSKF